MFYNKIKCCTIVGSPHTSVESYRAFCNLQHGSCFVLCLSELAVGKVLLHGAELFLRSTGFQLVNKFLTLYGTQRFINTFTSACHLSLSWASCIQSIPHPTSWRSILILFSHLRHGLPSGLPSLRPPHQKPVYTSPLFSSPPYVLHAQLISFFSRLSSENYLVSSTDY